MTDDMMALRGLLEKSSDADLLREMIGFTAQRLMALEVEGLTGAMDQAEPDVLAYMTFPKEHRTKLHSTNPIERLNGEIKRRTNVVGIFPNEATITRLIGAILLEQNDDWAVQRARYMTLESITPSGHDDLIRLPQTAA